MPPQPPPRITTRRLPDFGMSSDDGRMISGCAWMGDAAATAAMAAALRMLRRDNFMDSLGYGLVGSKYSITQTNATEHNWRDPNPVLLLLKRKLGCGCASFRLTERTRVQWELGGRRMEQLIDSTAHEYDQKQIRSAKHKHKP